MQKLLMRIEQSPWNGIYRIVIGASVPEAFYLVFGANGSFAAMGLFFLAALGLLRLLPAILRRLLPFSADLRSVWMRRRMLGKRYDSFQWQKLFWMGLGFAAHAVLSAKYRNTSLILALACGGPGIVGLIVWRTRLSTDKSIGTF